MSGFAVLDKIIDKVTQNPIPIIGMTAAEFTPQEKIQLSANIDLASKRGEVYSPRNLDDLRALLQ